MDGSLEAMNHAMDGGADAHYMHQHQHQHQHGQVMTGDPSLPLASDSMPHLPQPPMHMKHDDVMGAQAMHAGPFTASLPPPMPDMQPDIASQDVHTQLHAVRGEVAKLKDEVAMLSNKILTLEKQFFLPALPMGDAAAMHQAFMSHQAAAAAAAAAASDGPTGLPHSLEGFHANGLYALHAAAENLHPQHMLPAASAPQDVNPPPPESKPATKRARVESLQLEMDEQEVIAELRARGLIIDNPPEGDESRKGGRPPLGMGALKRVKDMYDKRQISMEAWRSYYQEKCRESGFDAKPHQHSKRQKFMNAGAGEGSIKHSVSYSFPAYNPAAPLNDNEVRLVRTLCGELTYPPDTDAGKKFQWVKALSDEHNFEALRLYLLDHRPLKNRRGKKPTGIENFPMVFDLWAASFIESSQFRRICKYSNIHIEQYQDEVQDNSNEEVEEEDLGAVGAAHHYATHHPLPPFPMDHHGGDQHAHDQAQLDAMAAMGAENSLPPPG